MQKVRAKLLSGGFKPVLTPHGNKHGNVVAVNGAVKSHWASPKVLVYLRLAAAKVLLSVSMKLTTPES